MPTTRYLLSSTVYIPKRKIVHDGFMYMTHFIQKNSQFAFKKQSALPQAKATACG